MMEPSWAIYTLVVVHSTGTRKLHMAKEVSISFNKLIKIIVF